MKTLDEISSQILNKINEFRWLLDELRSRREPSPDDLIILQGNLKDSILSIQAIEGGICPQCRGKGSWVEGDDACNCVGDPCDWCGGSGTLPDKTLGDIIEKELG